MAMRKTKTRSRRTVSRSATTRTAATRGGNPWSREEIAFLRQNYRKFETAWVARQLGRTVYSVRYKASDLNIKKANPSVWRGNTGGNIKPTRPTATGTRKPASRRTTSRTRYGAPAKRKVTRKAKPTKSTSRKTSSGRTKRTKKR